MQRYHSNSIRCIFLLLDTHPRAAPVIGRALFWCHRGNRMMGILTHERKRNRWVWLAPSARLPFRHAWGSQAAAAAVGPLAHPSEEGGSVRGDFFFPFPFSFPPPLLGTEAERGPAGYAAAVGLHPRVWRLGLHRGARDGRRHARDGEKETKSRKFFSEASKRFQPVLFSWGGPLLEKLRPQFSVEAKPAFFQCPRWSKFVFLWCIGVS